MRYSVLSVVTWLCAGLASAAAAWAQPQEPNFERTDYVLDAALNDATGMAWAPDGSNRLFIAMKAGTIRVIQGGALLGAPFASETVLNWSEAGLIGICFDRAFTTGRPYLYAFMTVSNTEQIIVRYNAAGNTQTGRTVLVRGLPTTGDTHMGGAVGIGADDKLYWAIGDNRAGPSGQGPGLLDTTTLQTKVGRANLDGTAPTDNPHYNAADGIGPTDYIWATGFRNPFTMTFHPVTGELWLNVVGGGAEQVFRVRRNDHGGWPSWDGGFQPQGTSAAPYGVYIDPKVTNRTEAWSDPPPPGSIGFGSPTAGACITGGVFYNGSSFPATHRYNFFFCDFEGGQIVRSVLNAAHTDMTSSSFFATNLGQLVDVDVGPDGALYYVGRTGGVVGRIQYTGTTPQGIVVSTNSLGVTEGSTATFTVRLAVAPASDVVVSVARSSGDADVGASPASLTFTPSNWNTPRTVTVSAAADADAVNDGATIRASSAGLPNQDVAVTVTDTTVVNGAPTATIAQPVNGAVVSGASAEFFGNGSDPQGVGTLVRAEFFIDDFTTPVYVDTTPGGHYHLGGGHALWDTTALSDGPHQLRMTVYDSGGLSGSHQITVTVDNSTTSPPPPPPPSPPPPGGGGNPGAEGTCECGTIGTSPVPALLAGLAGALAALALVLGTRKR
jgi:glucose/arabinose dehydrogenase